MLSFGKQGLLRLTGLGGLRVLKLDSGFAAEGCGGALVCANKRGRRGRPGFRRFKRCRGFRVFRHDLFVFISKICITVISGLWPLSPLWWLAPPPFS